MIFLNGFTKKSAARLVPAIVCAALFACDKGISADAPEVAPEVAVLTLAAQDLPMLTQLSGRVVAFRVSEVRPQVRGIIEKRLFAEGADVKAGDLLYQINSASYKALVDQASANLELANSNRENLRIIAERYEKLIGNHSVSRHDYELAQANHQQALAQVKASAAALQTAQIDLQRTQVRAPISGRVGRSSVSEGALVSAEQESALTRIQQFDPIYVDIVQSSQQLTQLKQQLASNTFKPGNSAVTLQLDGDHHYAYSGDLKFTDLNVDADTGMVTLRAQFANPEAVLLPGMYVRAALAQGVAANVILLPQQAVTYNEKNQPVAWVVNAQNQAELRILELLGNKSNQWIVRSGVSHGERVIVEGQLRLSPGATVAPIAWAAAAAPVSLVQVE